MNVSQNPITNLPASIERLENLEELNLFDLEIVVLPVHFKNLNRLKVIDLGNNPLESTRLLCEMKNLRKMGLTGIYSIKKEHKENLFTSLPDCQIVMN